MKRLILIFIILVTNLAPGLALPAAAAPAAQAPIPPDVLCMPGVYMVDPQDCLPLGPSSYLTRMAEMGITFPLRPLDAQRIDPALANLPYLYAILKEEANPVYATLEDAVAGQSPSYYIGAGRLKYVSYITYESTNNGIFYQLRDGGWVRVASKVGVSRSFPGGLTFTQTPLRPFGWILPLAPYIETKSTPGYASEDYTGHQLATYDVVQIYATQVVNDVEWYMVAPDEWVDQRYVGRVVPNTTPPEGVTNGRWIEVNLFEQSLAVYDQGRLVFATLIASGLDPFFTRPGLFPIFEKLESTPMAGAFEADRSDYYYLEDVPYTMYYDKARALHGAYWRTAFGFPQSHGCINLSPGDSHWLFDWAQEGDWVYVWDPSGATPTDPSYYGDGGA